MDTKLQSFFLITIVIYLSIIILLLKKKRLNLKYTLLWIFAGLVLLGVTIFPQSMYNVSSLLGIKTPINAALVIAGLFVIMILITLTTIVSKLNQNIRVLIQESAIMERRIRELEKEIKNV